MASTGTPVLCETARSAALALLPGVSAPILPGTLSARFLDSRARSAVKAAAAKTNASMFSVSTDADSRFMLRGGTG